MDSHFIGVSLLCMFVVLNGCGSSTAPKAELTRPQFPKDKYAGNFSSINRSDRKIRMLETTGFGWASPDAGNLGPVPKQDRTSGHWIRFLKRQPFDGGMNPIARSMNKPSNLRMSFLAASMERPHSSSPPI